MSETNYKTLCLVGIVALLVLGVNTVVRSKRIWIARKWRTGRVAMVWGWIVIAVSLILLAGYFYIVRDFYLGWDV